MLQIWFGTTLILGFRQVSWVPARYQNGFLSHAQMYPQLGVFAWIRAHDMLDLRSLHYGMLHDSIITLLIAANI